MVTKQKFRNFKFIGESCRYYTLKTETVPNKLRQRMLHKNGSVQQKQAYMRFLGVLHDHGRGSVANCSKFI